MVSGWTESDGVSWTKIRIDELQILKKLQELVKERGNPKGHNNHDSKDKPHCVECKVQRLLQSLLKKSEK